MVWAVNADLPRTAGFAGATQFVRPEDTADSIPCGPELDAIVDAVGEYLDAGFTDIAPTGGSHAGKLLCGGCQIGRLCCGFPVLGQV